MNDYCSGCGKPNDDCRCAEMDDTGHVNNDTAQHVLDAAQEILSIPAPVKSHTVSRFDLARAVFAHCCDTPDGTFDDVEYRRILALIVQLRAEF